MPVAVAESPDKLLSKALKCVNFASADPAHTESLRRWLGGVLSIAPDEICVLGLPSAPVVAPLLRDRLPQGPVRLLLAAVQQPGELELASAAVGQFMGSSPSPAIAAVAGLSRYDEWHIDTIICSPSDGFGARVKDALSHSAKIVAPSVLPTAAARGPAGTASGGGIVMDGRIMRMVRLAVASSSAVILVGPPGTGKTTIIRQLLQDIAYNPAAYGLSAAPKEPKWVTPSQEWTCGDLVGAEGLDDKGRRRFRSGHVLEAIRTNRWLVLDEANRANMDRIFGPLLTWLSDQRVELGRASSDANAPPVVLDWNDKPQCDTVRLDLLEADRITTAEPIRFLAGQDWRLIGTYNAQDAVKVFSFGGALGRRFARVPIPVIDPWEFRKALAPLAGCMPPDLMQMLVAMYAAHRRKPATRLGPAIFLKIASYIGAGIRLPQLGHAEHATAPSPAAPADDELVELLAEAYLSSAGAYLAHLPAGELAELGQAMVAAGVPLEQWQWIASLVPTLG